MAEGIEYSGGEYSQVVERCARLGLLEQNRGRLRLTDRGVLLSNEVFAELV